VRTSDDEISWANATAAQYRRTVVGNKKEKLKIQTLSESKAKGLPIDSHQSIDFVRTAN